MVNSSQESLVPKPKGWKGLPSKEKGYIVILGVVSVIALAFLAGFAAISYKYIHREKIPTTETPEPVTQLPPWLTIAPSTTTTQRPTPPPPGWDRCLDKGCALAAGRILSAITADASVDPCTDFYAYACGSWLENNPVHETESEINELTTIQQDVYKSIQSILEDPRSPFDEFPAALNMSVDYYDACLNFDNANNYRQLKKVLSSIFNSPDLPTRLAKAKTIVNGDYLFSTYVELDANDTEVYTLYLDQPKDFGLARDPLMNTSGSDYNEYIQLVDRVWPIIFNTTAAETSAIAEFVVFAESVFARLATPIQERDDETEKYNILTISELTELLDDESQRYDDLLSEQPDFKADVDLEVFDWQLYFDELFGTSGPVSAANITHVVVADLHYFKQLNTILRLIPKPFLENYLKWRTIFSLAEHASLELYEIMENRRKSREGTVYPIPRSSVCVEWTNTYFGMVLGATYVEESFMESYVAEVNQIVDNIKLTFANNINQYDWMSEEAKLHALDKLDNLNVEIAYPEWLFNNITNETFYNLNDHYQGLNLTTPTDHFTNMLEILAWKSEKSRWNYAMEKDVSSWPIDPTSIKAEYLPLTNTITFPATIFRSQWIIPSAKHVTYGSMGALIGREIARVLDIKGVYYDSQGKLKYDLDEDLIGNLTENAVCFVDQFNNYIDPVTDLTINGVRTRDENIADTTGFNLAMQAYVTNFPGEKLLPGAAFTKEQLVFLSYAQSQCSNYRDDALRTLIQESPLSPNQYRVQGVVKNSPYFLAAWGCAPAVEPCALWPTEA